MLLCDIEAAVSRIDSLTWDAETAHRMEDALLVEVLELIASGKCQEPERYAQEVLKTRELRFPRWCA